jgi:nitrate reductase NapD
MRRMRRCLSGVGHRVYRKETFIGEVPDMNICGCLVHAMPERAAAVRSALEATAGVEVHAEAEDGRLVVVVEDTDHRYASETIMALHQIPGVVSLTLNFHHFEEPGAARIPAPEQSADGGLTHDNL